MADGRWKPTFKISEKQKKHQKMMEPSISSKDGTKILTKEIVEYNRVRNNKQKRLEVVIKSNELRTSEFLKWYEDNAASGVFNMSKQDKQYYNSLKYGIESKHFISDVQNMLNEKKEKLICFKAEWVTEKQIKKRIQIQDKIDINSLMKTGGPQSMKMHQLGDNVIRQLESGERKEVMKATQKLFLSRHVPTYNNLTFKRTSDPKLLEIIKETKGTEWVTSKSLFKGQPAPGTIARITVTDAYSLTPLHLFACKVYQEEELWKRDITLEEYYAYAEVVLFNWMENSYWEALKSTFVGSHPTQLPVHAPLFPAFAFYSSVQLKCGTDLKFVPYRFIHHGNTDQWYYQHPMDEVQLQPASAWSHKGEKICDVENVLRPIVCINYARKMNYGAYGVLPVVEQVSRKLAKQLESESGQAILKDDHLKNDITAKMVRRSVVAVHNSNQDIYQSVLGDDSAAHILDAHELVFSVYHFDYYWESEGLGLTVPLLELML